MPKVKFMPQNVEFEILPNESVLDLSRRSGLTIKSICHGVPSCAECRVKVVGGVHNILPPSFKEKNLIGSAYFIDGSRLSCQLKPLGDIVVNLDEQIEKQNAPPVEKKAQLPRKYQLLKDQREAAAAAAATATAAAAAKAPVPPTAAATAIAAVANKSSVASASLSTTNDIQTSSPNEPQNEPENDPGMLAATESDRESVPAEATTTENGLPRITSNSGMALKRRQLNKDKK